MSQKKNPPRPPLLFCLCNPFDVSELSQMVILAWWTRLCVSGCVLVFAFACAWMSASVFVPQQHHHIFLWHTLCSKRRQKWRMEKRMKKCWLWQKPFWKATLSLFSHVLIQKRKYQLQRNVPTAALFSLSHTHRKEPHHTQHTMLPVCSQTYIFSQTLLSSILSTFSTTFIFT